MSQRNEASIIRRGEQKHENRTVIAAFYLFFRNMATNFSGKKDIWAVNAKLRLLTTAEGGRYSAIRSGYRPNHFFDSLTGSFIGEIQFDGEEITPGEERIVRVYFLSVPLIKPLLHKGTKWRVQESSKLIAIGEIIGDPIF